MVHLSHPFKSLCTLTVHLPFFFGTFSVKRVMYDRILSFANSPMYAAKFVIGIAPVYLDAMLLKIHLRLWTSQKNFINKISRCIHGDFPSVYPRNSAEICAICRAQRQNCNKSLNCNLWVCYQTGARGAQSANCMQYSILVSGGEKWLHLETKGWHLYSIWKLFGSWELRQAMNNVWYLKTQCLISSSEIQVPRAWRSLVCLNTVYRTLKNPWFAEWYLHL